MVYINKAYASHQIMDDTNLYFDVIDKNDSKGFL